MQCSPLKIVLSPFPLCAGIDEDFQAWMKAFTAEVFPVLEGSKSIEALVQQMMSCGDDSCACKGEEEEGAEPTACCRHKPGAAPEENPAEEV